MYKTASTVLTFKNLQDKDFTTTLHKRVSAYFKEKGISRHANANMVFKTIFMFSLYLIPYPFVYMTGNIWMMLGLYFIMGLGTAGIGLSVMHDANHGAYSSKKWLNRLIGYSLNAIGGNALNWKIQHNVFHHTYTNIVTHDEDIRPRVILRLSPHSPHYGLHKFQHIYAWFLYGLMTISWLLVKDFAQFASYQSTGMLKKHVNPVMGWTGLILSKIFYYGFIMVLPAIFTPFSIWQTILGFMVMQYVAGFILAIIFQPAHVMDVTEYPVSDDGLTIENNWNIHQMQTTCNFARKSKLFSWLVGGLNYQVEHHLFPNICHVHYKNLSPIVKQTAEEFNVPYHTMDTFTEALVRHGRALKKFGQAA